MKYLVLMAVVVMLSACTNMGVAPNEQNAEIVASLDMTTITLPERTVVIAEQEGKILLVSRSTPVLYEYDTGTGGVSEYNMEFIPRVAVALPDESGFAVFGDRGEGKKQSSWTFAVVKNNKATHLEISEPLAVSHAITWVQTWDQQEYGNQLVLGDIKSRSLAFLSTSQINKVLASGYGDVDIRRLSLDGNPYDFVMLDNRYIVVSYIDNDYLDIIDLYEGGSVGRHYSKFNYHKSYLFDFEIKSEPQVFFTIDQEGERLSLHQLHKHKGYFGDIENMAILELNLDYKVKEYMLYESNQALPFSAKRFLQPFWTASHNELISMRIGQDSSSLQSESYSLQIIGTFSLPVIAIDQIISLPKSKELMLYSIADNEAMIIREIDLLDMIE